MVEYWVVVPKVVVRSPLLTSMSSKNSVKHLNNIYYNSSVYRDIMLYSNKSVSSRTSDQVSYFESVGSYRHQWVYLWFQLGFWYNESPNIKHSRIDYVYKKYDNTLLGRKICKKSLLYKDTLEYKFEVKYVNRVNKSFDITRFVSRPFGLNSRSYKLEREESITPGKFGEFTKARRKDFIVLISFWDYFFKKLMDSYESIQHHDPYISGEFKVRNDFLLDYFLFFRLHSVNNMFIRYFYIIKVYIQRWPSKSLYFIMRNHFRKGNLVLKNKRYMRKFKIKVLHKSDRFNRRHILLGI